MKLWELDKKCDYYCSFNALWISYDIDEQDWRWADRSQGFSGKCVKDTGTSVEILKLMDFELIAKGSKETNTRQTLSKKILYAYKNNGGSVIFTNSPQGTFWIPHLGHSSSTFFHRYEISPEYNIEYSDCDDKIKQPNAYKSQEMWP